MKTFKVWDARTRRVLHGEYDSRPAAQAAADQLNTFVHQNSNIGRALAGVSAEVRGPFYAGEEKEVARALRA